MSMARDHHSSRYPVVTHTSLRAANVERQREWDPSDKITLSYRLNELAGETGEACNVGKKLERERLGIRGSRDTVEHLAEELADIVICTDLVAMSEGIDLDQAVADKFNATSEKVGLMTRLAHRAAYLDAVETNPWVSRVMEIREEHSGFWKACSGCQEGVEGQVSSRDYPYSAVFACQPGGGCSECGGLGVTWDNTDYDDMAQSILSSMAESEKLDLASAALQRVLPEGVCLTNSNVPDDQIVCIDATMGDLRKIAAAAAALRGS